MNRPRDSQKNKLYTWERLLPNGEELPWEEAKALAVAAIARYDRGGVPSFGDGRGASIARGGAYFIKLPRWARTPRTILHEATHTIICRKLGTYCHAWHGPEFLRLFLDLYDHYVDSGQPLAVWTKFARQARLKVGRRQFRPIKRGRGKWYRAKNYGRIRLLPGSDVPARILSPVGLELAASPPGGN